MKRLLLPLRLNIFNGRFYFAFIFTVIICASNLNTQAQIQLGLDIDGEALDDHAGCSISMPDANTLAIGASNNDGSGSDAGQVRVYTWNGSAWVQKGLDIEGEAAGDNSGQFVSMPDSNTVAIGATGNDGTGIDAGQVRIYTWNGSAWIQKGQDIDGESADDQSGWAVSMPDVNTVAIGAYNNDGSSNDAGHVRIYTWSGSAWIQKGIDIDGEAADDNSGWTINMPDSNTVAIGAINNDGIGINVGQVRVFSWDGIAWVQKGIDIDGEADSDNSGYSVCMPDSNTLAIGARYNDGNGTTSGQVRIYSWNGIAWQQKGSDIDGEASQDFSGGSVWMSDNNTVAIGAATNDGINGSNSGHVRIYSWDGIAWVQMGIDIDGEAPGDQAFHVCMPDANTVAIGAWFNDGNGANAGQTRVYTFGSVGIQQNDFENMLAIYPNPTHGKLYLDLGSTCNDVVVIVRNVMGQEIYTNSFGATNKLEFAIPGEAGIYFIELNADNKKTVLKALKE